MTSDQLKLWTWLIKQGPETVLAVLDTALVDKETLFKSAAEWKHRIEKAGRRKGKQTDAELEKIHQLRFDRLKLRKEKQAKVAMKIERQYYVIKRLRESGGSWLDILEYLKKYHSIEVSRGYFHRVWVDLQKKYEEGTDGRTEK